MSHLIETYAANSGSTIKKPQLLEKFYPLDFSDYITIQASSKFPAKCWDYYNELVEFLLPTLNEHGIKIVQLGAKDDAPIKGCVNLCGLTSIAQTHYLLSRALLHVGNDSFQIHSCSILGTPLVGLYSISPPEVCGPYWKNDKQITLMVDLKGNKPSYSPQENPKSVNRIKIETVIDAVNQLLKLSVKNNFSKINSIHFGEAYSTPVHEFVPDAPFNPQIAQNQIIHCRLDFLKSDPTNENYQYLLQTAAQRKVVIYTEKPFNLEPFKQVRQNIALIVYRMPKNDDIEFVKSLKRGGFQHKIIKEYVSYKDCAAKTENLAPNAPEKSDIAPLLAECSLKTTISPHSEKAQNSEHNNLKLSHEDISALKFKYLDVAPIQFVEKKHAEIPWQDNLMYKSNRYIYSNNLTYKSKFAYENDLTDSNNQIKIKTIEELQFLLLEQEYLYIFQKS